MSLRAALRDTSAGTPSLVLGSAAAGLALVASTGIVADQAFSRASLLRYLVSVAVPMLVAAAAFAPRPLLVLTPALIVASPFAPLSTTVGGLEVTLGALLMLGGAITAIVAREHPWTGRLSWTAKGALIAMPLLTVATVAGDEPVRILSLAALGCTMAWIVACTCGLPNGRVVVMFGLLGSAALQASIALWQVRTGNRLNLYGEAGQRVFDSSFFFSYGDTFRPTGAFFDPISLGNLLALALPIGLALLMRPAVRFEVRLVTAGATAIIGWGLIVSLSRMSWVGAAAGIVVAVALLPRLQRRVAGVGLGIVVGALALVAVRSASYELQERLISVFDPTSRGVETAAGDRLRLSLWDAATQTIGQHPFAGTGFGRLDTSLSTFLPGVPQEMHAHSIYLQFTAEAGVIGVAALAGVIVGALLDLATGFRTHRILVAGAAGGLCAFLVCGLTDFTIRYPAVAFSVAALLGLVASFATPAESANRSAR